MRFIGVTPLLLLLFCGGASLAAVVSESEPEGDQPKGRTFYVRQTVGDDANDGASPETAWENISRLSEVLKAGDVAYIGPGLYRDKIILRHSGTAENPIRIIADSSGKHTGDPPGIVMIAGSDPVDEEIFTPHSTPGVFTASLGDLVIGVVEMNGLQYRYKRARDTMEFLRQGMTKLEVVAALPSSFFYDPDAKTLYLHTSDGRPPSEHEIELIRRGNGILVSGQSFVTIVGFTLRHMGDGGLSFWHGASNIAAINNTSYGGRQGIRVYGATDVLVVGNTLFRNDNSGVYFAKESTGGFAIGNTCFDNLKGIRWSSQSNGGLAINNTVFNNSEMGISIEEADGVRVANNRLIDNYKSQLLVYASQYESDGNCFHNGSSDQVVAMLGYAPKYYSLSDYQEAGNSDRGSSEGDCGPVSKVDVQKLHAEAMAYAARARELLAKDEPIAAN